MKISIDTSLSFVDENFYSNKKNLKKFEEISSSLHSDQPWTAWVNYPSYKIQFLGKIKRLAKKVKTGDVLLVIGVGGSYLGALAGISALKNKGVEVLFAGTNFSYEDLKEKFDYCKNKEVFINVISKSGTTTETMIAFEYALKFLKTKYKSNFKDHLIITTDKEKGYLREYAKKNKIESLIVPDNIGGRYSVLTDVGLFPLICAGIDIKKFLQGAVDEEKALSVANMNNPAYRYALTRFILNTKKGKNVEILSSFYPKLSKVGEWWTQLFAESEGKDKKGLFVSSLNFSTDLHSVGQFIQQGSPLLFETFLNVDNVEKDNVLQNIDPSNPISYLNGKSVEEVNLAARKGTIKAHSSAKVPIIQINIEKIDEENLGSLFYFFEYACAISGKLLGVDPFNQPGVEDYKRNMKKLLSE